MQSRKVVWKLLLPLLALTSAPTRAQRNTDIPAIDSLPVRDWHIPTPQLSYKKAVFYSLIFPGGGQIYGKHYVRAGFLIGLEGGLASFSWFGQSPVIRDKERVAGIYLDSAQFYYNRSKTDPNYFQDEQWKDYVSDARRELDTKKKQEDLRNSQWAWTAGLHFYGMMDAIQIVRDSHGFNEEKLSTGKAFWRALAFPGWGQIYNGKYGKFGMLWMALGSSAASIYFRQQMVDHFQDRLRQEQALGNNSYVSTVRADITTFRKSRNQYYWGIALLYLYSVGDAVVDAALNDFDAPERYALVPGPLPFSLAFQASF